MVESVTQIKSGITMNVWKKIRVCKKYYILNPAFCSCENGKYLASIIDDSVIMHDEIIEETKSIPTHLN